MGDTQLTVLIPARGGSKGLPGKNMKHVGGIPLVGRAVRTGRRALRRIGGCGRVVCSTDSEEIAAVAREWGAEVPFLRAAALATDSATSMDVVMDVITRLDLAPWSILILLQPTSPFVDPEDVARAVDLHLRVGAPVVGVAEEAHPAEWTFPWSSDGRLGLEESAREPVGRRQEAVRRVRICGAVYVAQVGWLVENRSFVHDSTRALVIPGVRAVDIDTEADLSAARGIAADLDIPPVELGPVTLDCGHPPLVIAEAGVNHNGDLDLAFRLIDAAKEAGADAVKFQTFRSESVVSPLAEQAEYQRHNTGLKESQLEMVRRLELTPDQTKVLSDHCGDVGILFLSSPFDAESADLLVSLGVPALKVGSGELTNHPFLSHLASLGRPLLISTGMAKLSEVAHALDAIEASGSPPVALLHCVSSYPAPPAEANLAALRTLREAFSVHVGFSDHTPGLTVPVAAAALGASIIEKHFTLDRTLPGPDHRASLEPAELAELTRAVADAWQARGDGVKRCMPCEEDVRRVARRSVFAARDLPAGKVLEAADLVALRPGTGISPARWWSLVGRTTSRPLTGGEMLAEADLD